MRVILVLAIFAATMLAGCNGDPNGFVPDECSDPVLCDPDAFYSEHYCTDNDVRPRVYAPDSTGPDTQPDPWELGRYWTYSLQVDGEDLGETQLIYYDLQDQGAHYMVGTPTREEALHHALFSTNPVIGRVHKTLYSPHESGAHADMFHFPLCEGSTWTDTFFDTEFAFAAKQTGVTLPGGGSDSLGFSISGTAADGSKVAHTYSPQAKWFTQIDLDRADGKQVDMQLTDVGSGYVGDAFFLRGQQDHAIVITAETAAQDFPAPRENGGAGPYDTIGFHADLERVAGNGFAQVHVIAPDGNMAFCVGITGDGIGQDTSCENVPYMGEVPFMAGEWTIQYQLPITGETQAEGKISMVSIYDRSGSV